MKRLRFIRTVSLAVSLLLSVTSICIRSHAVPGDVDLSFDPGSAVTTSVSVVIAQPDGKVLIGGAYTFINGTNRYGSARLEADGSWDDTFIPSNFNPDLAFVIQTADCRGGPDFECSQSWVASTVLVQADGKVLVGGYTVTIDVDLFDNHPFETYRSFLARVHADGSRDTNFTPVIGGQTDVPLGVSALAVQLDGKVLVGGPTVWFGRRNADGSEDTSFNPDITGRSWVASIVLQADGKVLIGGGFSTMHGTNVSYGIARLNANGTLDGSFNPGGGTFGVSTVAVQPDGKVLIAGDFTAVSGTARNRMARLNADGGIDFSFDPGAGANGLVRTIALQSDGNVLLGGDFTAVNGTPRHGLARLNTGGSLDASFNPGGPVNDQVFALALQPDGRLLLGGVFTAVGGFVRTGLARLNADGSLDNTFNTDIKFLATASYVKAVAVQPDGKVLATGIFAPTNGAPSGSIARFNADGSWDPSFQPNLWPFVQPGDCVPGFGCWQSVEATSVLILPDGKVLVGGHAWTVVYGDEFSYDVIRHFLARFDTNGTLDGSFNSSTNYFESCLVRQPDGKFLVGGAEGISRLNSTGSLDLSFNAGAVNGIRSIAIQPDGKIIIGGGFFTVNGTPRNRMARLHANGSLDLSFNPGAGVSGTVHSVALQPDGKVLAGGEYYELLNGTNYLYGITRRNADGTLDAGFNHGTTWGGAVRSVALQPDGNILIGGNFTTVKTEVRPRVARLYGDATAPSLSITRSNAFVIISWPETELSSQLQETTNLSLPNSWSPVAQSADSNAGQISVTVPTSVGTRFFRLQR